MVADKSQERTRILPPLAERMRPVRFEEFIGQEQITGQGKIIRHAIETGKPFSMILWGPPGTGKTTLAKLFSTVSGACFTPLSAVSSGVREVREIIEKARFRLENGRKTIVFIDEIHRFNKAQQDALLHAVENGTIILIGATTENPSFEVISPLLSRCRVLKLEPLKKNDLEKILDRALQDDILLSQLKIIWKEGTRDYLVNSAGGDARKMLNVLDIVLDYQGKNAREGEVFITSQLLAECLQQQNQLYDKKGDYHYDIISAFIKSVRGSDPDAAVFWLALMLEGGEDPLFIARRLVILASEDIGNADPHGLPLAVSGFQAAHLIGMPEAAIILAQVATYLASAPKSNASYKALRLAQSELKKNPNPPVPMHLRNAPTKMMEEFGYSEGYQYPHDFKNHFVSETYLPENLKESRFYFPGFQGYERFIRKRLSSLWGKRFDPGNEKDS